MRAPAAIDEDVCDLVVIRGDVRAKKESKEKLTIESREKTDASAREEAA
jgi:hypothetical protein